MIDFLVQHALAGTWNLIWHWGLGLGLMGLCIVAAIFLPVFKKDFIYCAVIIGVFLLAMAIGTRDAAKRSAAQQVVVSKRVDSVVKGTSTPASHAARDKWDNPNY